MGREHADHGHARARHDRPRNGHLEGEHACAADDRLPVEGGVHPLEREELGEALDLVLARHPAEVVADGADAPPELLVRAAGSYAIGHPPPLSLRLRRADLNASEPSGRTGQRRREDGRSRGRGRRDAAPRAAGRGELARTRTRRDRRRRGRRRRARRRHPPRCGRPTADRHGRRSSAGRVRDLEHDPLAVGEAAGAKRGLQVAEPQPQPFRRARSATAGIDDHEEERSVDPLRTRRASRGRRRRGTATSPPPPPARSRTRRYADRSPGVALLPLRRDSI